MRRLPAPAMTCLIATSLFVASCGSGATTDTSSPETTASSTTVVAQSTTTESTVADSTTETTPTQSTTPTPAQSQATTPDPATKVSYRSRKVGTLAAAVDVVERSPQDDFVYVVSRNGVIERWGLDGRRRDVVLDISSRTTGEGERGLLGLAFRASNPAGPWAAYLNVTDKDGNTDIIRYDVAADGTFAATSTTILEIDQPYANHNGGDLEIGPDNMLYVAMGDGGSGGDPERRATNTSSLLGKILRIDPHRTGYRIPADNPMVNVAGARPEIWSMGLRNPWRINFDSRGNLWVADVGQNEWEEVSVARAAGSTPGGRGINFGWSAYEGTHRYNDDVDGTGTLMPVHEYKHDDGRCSISGGATGTTTATPGRAGWYFYSDYCSGEVTALRVVGSKVEARDKVASKLGNVTAVRLTSQSLWVTTLDGAVYQITIS